MAGRHQLPEYARRRGGAPADPDLQIYCTSLHRYPQPLWEWEREGTAAAALMGTSGIPHRRVMEEHTQGGDSEEFRRCNSHMGPGQKQPPTICQSLGQSVFFTPALEPRKIYFSCWALVFFSWVRQGVRSKISDWHI